MSLTVARAPDEDRVEPVLIRHAVRQMIAARRPGVVADLTSLRVCDFGYLLVGNRQDIDLAVFVAEGDAFPVGRPLWRVTKCLAATRELFRRTRSILCNNPNFFFSGCVRDVSDARSIRRPTRPFVVRA